jgi:cation-transporting ATPase E
VVFGRTAPAQKARIIDALQARGHYVAMIGDGVNDVPALKTSHVAISVRAGSPVTRSIADLLLLEDSFSALPFAFREGQRIRSGMQSVVRLFLVRTFAVALMIFGVGLFASEFPVTPRLTAIQSTLTVGLPALLLAAWALPERTAKYLVPASARFVAPAAALLGIMCIAVYQAALHIADVDVARTTVTAAAILAGVALIPFVDDPREEWLTVRGLANPRRAAALAGAMLALFALSMASPSLRTFYELEALGWQEWLLVAGGVAAWLFALAFAWRLVDRGQDFLRGGASRAPRSAARVPPGDAPS